MSSYYNNVNKFLPPPGIPPTLISYSSMTPRLSFHYFLYICLYVVLITWHMALIPIHCLTRYVPNQFCTFHFLELLPKFQIVDVLSAIHMNIFNYSSCSISKILYQNFNILHFAFPAFSSNFPFCCSICCASWDPENFPSTVSHLI